MAGEKKIFSAELARMRQLGHVAQAAGPGGQPTNSDIMKAINGLRDELRSLERLIAPELETETEGPALVELPAEQVEQQRAEVNLLKTELRALAVCIEQTKLEIAALRPPQSDEDRLVAVTFELDAIVTATERATQNILDSAEKIDNLSRSIQSHVKDAYTTQVVEDISEHIVTIFEACNFQDITGQRITKIVNTLKYIEDRVNAMIHIWGAESFHGLPMPEEVHDDEERKLLNGPQLENRGISQDEIDKLFG